MAIYYFTNISPGAPGITNTAGSFIAAMDYCLVTGMGWTKTHSATNLATYRAPAGNRIYLAIDDTNANYARLRAFESVTTAGVSISAGINPTPSDLQNNGGLYFNKRNGTASEWFFVSDGLFFYFGTLYASSWYKETMAFGDFISYKSSDNYSTIIKSNTTTDYDIFSSYTNTSTLNGSSYVVRPFTQLGYGIPAGVTTNNARSKGATYFGGGGSPYPNPITNTLDMAIVEIFEGNSDIRGRMPGMWNPLHATPLANGDIFTGSGILAGKQFLVRSVGGFQFTGQIFLEISDTWRT